MHSRTGIIAAMESEFRDLADSLDHCSSEKIAGREILYGTLEGENVALLLCGCGKVNATHAATLMACQSRISRLLVTGVSGGLSEGLKVGDVIIGDSFVQHDMDARPLFPRHVIPFEGYSEIGADPSLRELLRAAAKTMLATERLPGLEEAKMVEGLVVSGDQFLSSTEARNEVLSSLPHAVCADMESAAVAQVCRAAGIPLGVMRIISDSADGSAHIDFAKFVEESASKACAATVRHALRALAR